MYHIITYKLAFLQLLIALTALFGIIHESYHIISTNFTFVYRTFSKKFSISIK